MITKGYFLLCFAIGLFLCSTQLRNFPVQLSRVHDLGGLVQARIPPHEISKPQYKKQQKDPPKQSSILSLTHNTMDTNFPVYVKFKEKNIPILQATPDLYPFLQMPWFWANFQVRGFISRTFLIPHSSAQSAARMASTQGLFSFGFTRHQTVFQQKNQIKLFCCFGFTCEQNLPV